MRIGVATGTAVVIMLLAACSTSPTRSVAKEPPLDASVMAVQPTAIDPHKVQYPLNAYNGGTDDAHAINLAEAILEQACFHRLGLDLPMPAPPDARPFPVYDWYGLWDEDSARTYGYESPPFMGAGQPFPAIVPDDWKPLLVGPARTFHGLPVPDGGCQGAAERDLGLVFPSGINGDLVENLQRDAVARAHNHSAVVSLIPAWRKCLETKGYKFNDPSDPFQYWMNKAERPIQPDQVSAALADVECKKQTGLLRAWVAADVAYQRQEVEANATSLHAFNEWRQNLLRNANRVIAAK